MTNEYIHGNGGRVHSVAYPDDAREVLVVIYPGDNTGQHRFGPLAVVPGFVDGQVMRSRWKRTGLFTFNLEQFTLVDAITSQMQKSELTDIVRKNAGFDIPVEF